MKSLEELHYLLKESLRKIDNTERNNNKVVSEYLTTAISDLELAKSRCKSLTGKIKIAIVGRGNVGKTTLLNAVLGKGFFVAPTANKACTATIVEFSYGESFKIRSFPQARAGTLSINEETLNSEKETKEKLADWVEHGDGENLCRKVEVQLPAPILKSGLILIDTPGFGAAKEAGGYEDDKLIEEFLKNDVANIFWMCSMAVGGLSKKDEEYLRTPEIRQKCDDLIFSDADEIIDEPDEKRRVHARYSHATKTGTRFHFTDGKQAKYALENSDSAKWERSGLKDVCFRIQTLSDKPGREKLLKEFIRSFLENLTNQIQEMRERGDLTSWIFPPTVVARFLKNTAGSNLLPAEWFSFLRGEKQISNN